jgi:hypothetical protein
MGKNDLTSTRGKRNPASVFDTPESRALLQSFAFYTGRPITATYTGQINCDTTTGLIVFTGGTSDFFHAPKGATHVRIKAAVATLDFDKKLYQIHPAPAYTAPLEDMMPPFHFGCDMATAGSGSRIGIVAIEFLQEKNGELYGLADGMSLGIVG